MQIRIALCNAFLFILIASVERKKVKGPFKNIIILYNTRANIPNKTVQPRDSAQ
jgi:hypothetical protein